MLILAKSVKGQEFLYSKRSAHKVPKTSADKICEALNKINYDLKNGETWFKHEVTNYDDAYIFAETQAFRVSKGTLKEIRR